MLFNDHVHHSVTIGTDGRLNQGAGAETQCVCKCSLEVLMRCEKSESVPLHTFISENFFCRIKFNPSGSDVLNICFVTILLLMFP